MFILGIRGGVRLCMSERVSEYGDCGVALDSVPSTFVNEGVCGPIKPLFATEELGDEGPFFIWFVAALEFIFETSREI